MNYNSIILSLQSSRGHIYILDYCWPHCQFFLACSDLKNVFEMFCYHSNSPFFLSCQFLFVLKWLHINFSFLRIFAINLRGPMQADFLFIITCKDNRFISWIYEHWTCYIEIALLRIQTLAILSEKRKDMYKLSKCWFPFRHLFWGLQQSIMCHINLHSPINFLHWNQDKKSWNQKRND